MQRRTEIREIPSSLDLRPLSERYCRQQQRPQPSQKYSHILSIVDCGKKQSLLLESKVDSTQFITKLRGELFSRLAPDALAKFLRDGTPHYIRTNSFLFN